VGTSHKACDRGTMTSTSEMATLAADFPGWHVWRGRSGNGAEAEWHATAHPAARKPGTLGRLAAPNAPGLRALLGRQGALRRELAA
jgi:hypothetical protein